MNLRQETNYYSTVVSPYKAILSTMKKSILTSEVSSLEGDHLIVFSICAAEIWPDKRMAFGGSGFIRGNSNLYVYKYITDISSHDYIALLDYV